MKTDINKQINSIINKELNTSSVNKFISKVHEDLDLRYNSLNIVVGRPGTSKTTLFMKTMMKLNYYPNNFHLIIYVSNNESDDTFLKLKQYINIPIVQITYDNILDTFVQLIQTKEEYWEAHRNKDEGLIEELGRQLYVKSPFPFNIQTMIFMDDAVGVVKKKSPWTKFLTQLRHLQCSFWLNLHFFSAEAFDSDLKPQLTSLYLSSGIPHDKLSYAYRQINSGATKNEFLEKYMLVKGYQKLFVDCKDGLIKIID